MVVKFVQEINPYDVKAATKVMQDALDFDGVAVVISKCPCPLELKKQKQIVIRPVEVHQDKCIKCYNCVRTIACPALFKGKNGEISTDPTQCIGCGMCANVCPTGAIEVRK
ncbi:MAG: 4Fe-4S binding protein [Candidatus Methanomethylophilaceae archaeon]|nr:4Fe-4S binding protein [Candidatus Methanomethylophilaceae archaeon]